MASLAWDKGLATGVQTMDVDHRLQISLINAFEALLKRKENGGLAERTIAQLVDFTSLHFLSEELMMRLHGYPGLEAHQAEHARLLGSVSEIRRRIGSAEGEATAKALDELRQWLVEHIQTMDHAFAQWCKLNDVRPGSSGGETGGLPGR